VIGFGFTGRFRLKKTDEFSSVFNFRKRIFGPGLLVYYKPNAIGHARLGLVVAKKITRSAVQRNYMKRILRELFRQQQLGLGGLDIVVRPQKTFSRCEFLEIKAEFQGALDHLRK